MRYMLNTDICIYTITERPPAVLRAFRQFQPAGLGISSVTAAELFFGVARTGSQRNLDALRRFLATLAIASFDAAAAEVSGSMRAWLASQGTPIGPYDSVISAFVVSRLKSPHRMALRVCSLFWNGAPDSSSSGGCPAWPQASAWMSTSAGACAARWRVE